MLLRLCATDGTLLQEASVAIAAQGVGTLSDLFGSSVEIDEGYVQVQTRQLVVPRLFVDNHGGDTEIRLLNVGDTEPWSRSRPGTIAPSNWAPHR